MEYVLGIDLGTSYFKVGLFDKDMNMRGLGRVALEKDTQGNSECELPIERFWETLKKGLSIACEQAGADQSDIVAMSYSSQADSFVLLDENYTPLTPLVLWPDNRCKGIHPKLKELFDHKDFLQKTGYGRGCYNTLTINKLLWFQDNRPEIWKKTKHIMIISDYLTYSLTGKCLGDAGTVALLGLFDLENFKWWNQALELIGIEESMLSRPLQPTSVVGKTNTNANKLLGLTKPVEFAVGSLDHHIAAIGAGVGSIADMSESTGTVLACVSFCDEYKPTKNISMGPAAKENSFYKIACDFDGGATAIEWYKNNYAKDLSIDELVKLAEDVAPDCAGLSVDGLASDYEGLSGFRGATEKHSHGHYIRAMMNYTAKSLAQLVTFLDTDNTINTIVATGGGAKSDLWLEIKTKLLNRKFITAESSELACKGAAMVAAVAAGWFDSLESAGKA